MDVVKYVEEKEFILFGKVFFKIRTKFQQNDLENCEPIQPVVELNLYDDYSDN